MNLKPIFRSNIWSVTVNLAWVYVMYAICRLIFLWQNWDQYADHLTASAFGNVLPGGWRFDTSAIFYTNSLYILLALLPLHLKERPWYHTMTKWVYVTVNSLALLANLADTVFFQFRSHRSTWAVFSEFDNESNLAGIIGTELLSHWYLAVIFAAGVWLLAKAYRRPDPAIRPLWRYYTVQTLSLAVAGLIAVCGMRGNIFFLSATRPISSNYAFQFVDRPVDAGLVLNTPFSIIRTIGRSTMPVPRFYDSSEALDAVYTPLHRPAPGASMKKKNVVILIVESFAQEFIGGLNKDLDGGTYKGYTPYMDEMLDSCMYFDQMIANTYFSIDAAPAVLSGIPRFEKPFVVSPFATNHISSIARELKNEGYTSAFFHGADNESLGIQAFTRQAGVDRYYGRNEFYADPRFGGRSEFDGTWGVWDEPFLQFFCATLCEMRQPFVAAVFTLSSHHPFRIPEKYADRFTDEGEHLIHKCIRYTDYSIHQFFESARKQPWFDNTVFVITADHASSKRTHAEYKTVMGDHSVPILIYDPSGELPRGRRPGIAQQTDIMPTLLGYLGYDKPFIAFGKDLLATPADSTWAFACLTLPVYIKGDYVMQFDGSRVTGLHNYRTDPLEKENLAGRGLEQEAVMEREVKAIVQSYLERMNADSVAVRH